MKTIKNLFVIALMLGINACATTSRFPVSDVVPAANITASKGKDKQNNYTIEVNAKNLASADRLTPPGKNYSIWIVTNSNGVKNIGQLMIKNAEKTTFKTVTPFDFYEIFITVENDGDLQSPQGIEISRTKL